MRFTLGGRAITASSGSGPEIRSQRSWYRCRPTDRRRSSRFLRKLTPVLLGSQTARCGREGTANSASLGTALLPGASCLSSFHPHAWDRCERDCRSRGRIRQFGGRVGSSRAGQLGASVGRRCLRGNSAAAAGHVALLHSNSALSPAVWLADGRPFSVLPKFYPFRAPSAPPGNVSAPCQSRLRPPSGSHYQTRKGAPARDSFCDSQAKASGGFPITTAPAAGPGKLSALASRFAKPTRRIGWACLSHGSGEIEWH